MLSIIVPYQAWILLADHILQKSDFFCKVQSHKRCGSNYQETKRPRFYICLKNSTQSNYAEVIIYYGLSNLTLTDSPTSFLL